MMWDELLQEAIRKSVVSVHNVKADSLDLHGKTVQ